MNRDRDLRASDALLDEVALAGPEHLDRAYVAGYDRKAGFDPADDVALLLELGLGRDDTLIDFGAGTGSLAVAVAPHCRRVVAVDVSAAMVAATEERAQSAAIENVACVRAGILGYDHAGPPAEFVYSRNALHHLPDFWKAIALHRVAGMLRPGGMLRLRDLVFSFDAAEAGRVVDEWLATAAERPEDGWTREELEAHLREEHSTFAWLLEPMLERAGFEIRDTSYSANRIFAAYVCVKRG